MVIQENGLYGKGSSEALIFVFSPFNLKDSSYKSLTHNEANFHLVFANTSILNTNYYKEEIIICSYATTMIKYTYTYIKYVMNSKSFIQA